MNELIDRLIDLAFAEDIGDGDHTTLSCIPATAMGKSKLLIKEAGVLAGIEIAKEIFHRFDPTMKVEVFINDGAEVKPGDVAMIVEGKIQSDAERDAAHERYCHYDTQIREAVGRHENTCAGYPQDYSRTPYA